MKKNYISPSIRARQLTSVPALMAGSGATVKIGGEKTIGDASDKPTQDQGGAQSKQSYNNWSEE